jgi:hypothetical protein
MATAPSRRRKIGHSKKNICVAEIIKKKHLEDPNLDESVILKWFLNEIQC